MSTTSARAGASTTSPSAGTDGLAIRGLEVVYNNAVVALRGVSLSVPEGGFVSVLGANGAGKTTLVRAITNLLFVHDGRVRDGSVTYGGQSLLDAGARAVVRAGICQVPEGRMLFPRLTVDENLRVGASTRKVTAADVAAELEHVYEVFPQIADRRDEKAGLMSGGEQQMVAVGRALMAKPRLMICDELSLGLAPLIVKDLFELVSQLNREEGMGVLVIEQNARVALQHSNYGYVMETGKVVVEGTSASLSEDDYVQEFYLGGAGEAKDAYEELVARYRKGNGS
ncbi:ABC transporter ATP-binding protein [Euzebya tangerina]|uniref:ABC transporter ATP-binding protein n=1 Tax=Euzebya tangerina TaxID=591198 RepID=UPI000E312CED|nr:ABC transporter ATP-binding protein [Euzebya tangerina]